jgi:hypothetical protein
VTSPAQAVMARLEGVKPAGQGRWMAKCPAHDDRQASLSVREGDDGRVLLNCHAGCRTEDVVANIELGMEDLFPPREQDAGRPAIVAEYNYRDESGKLLYQAVRLSPKSFRQRKPAAAGGWEWKLEDVRRVLYRFPELLAAPKAETVWIAEGEKDVEALARIGLVATTNVGGAGKWRPDYSEALRGHPVAILPDNDDPGRKHAAEVAAALAGIAESVRVVALPGLPPKGDVSDWLAAGGTPEQLKALATKAPEGVPVAVSHRFQSSVTRLSGEREERLQNSEGILTFGISFLDHALGGITRKDLILVGAKSGVGKTSAATIAALANCRRGKRVHYFALEAEDREIERRMKFQIIAEMYYGRRMHTRPIRFQDWYNGLLDYELGPFEAEADEALASVLVNLSTFYRTDSFTSDDFRVQFEAITAETDLVILDHFHYIDDDDRDENKSAKRSVKMIRDCVLRAGRPVVIVAHVRKSDRRNDTLLPTLEDFHGSSDLPKIATKAVMIAPAYDIQGPEPFLWPTYLMAAKCRTDMSVTRYVSQILFNTRQNAYEESYELGRLTDAGKQFSSLAPQDVPTWARASNSESIEVSQ